MLLAAPGQTTASGAATGLETVSYGSSQSLTAAQKTQARSNISAALKGHIHGLTLSNNSSDATNDIDIAIGETGSTQTSPILISISSALTKQLDADWASGDDAGMRYSGAAIANGTYHIYAGCEADGTNGDIYAYPDPANGTDVDGATFIATVLSAWQAETGGSSYAHIRRIGSI